MVLVPGLRYQGVVQQAPLLDQGHQRVVVIAMLGDLHLPLKRTQVSVSALVFFTQGRDHCIPSIQYLPISEAFVNKEYL